MTSITQTTDAGPAPSSSTPAGWAKFLPVLLGMLAILGFYHQTAQSMAYQWWNYETYTHGMVVPLVSAWLIWRRRDEWLHLPAQPQLWMVLPLALASFAWLLGDLAIVFPVTQFAFVAMLVLIVPALLGWPIARINAFPLLFLFFSVPVGEVLLPTLMAWTADFTVTALRFTGIPVYREGQQFIIPSGHWSVVEACSGIRYLIASAMVGTLYAYLTYRSLKRRLLFCVVALLVPLVANWLRAYMIVMIGHLSDNRLATGVDHLIYGWVFFGLVMMLMFWIGAWWREDTSHHTPVAVAKPVSGVAGLPVRSWGICLLVVLVAGTGHIGSLMVVSHDKGMPAPRLSIPANLGPWQAATDFTDWRPRYAEPSAKMQQSYGKGDNKVGVYIAYYRGQTTERKLISSANILVASSDNVWSRVTSGRVTVPLAGSDVDVLATELLKRDRSRLMVWSWYWVDGQFTASDYRAKAYTAWSRLMGHGDDSAVVMVFVPKQVGQDTTAASLKAFLADAVPVIGEALTRTSQAR